MIRTLRLALGVLAVAVVLLPSPTWAEVSLAMEDRIDMVAVKIKGTEEKFTLIRDAWNRFQWYVVPNKPRLAERVVDGKHVPELSLFLLQTDDSAKAGTICEEALLQFGVSLAIPAEAIEPLRAKIAEREGVDASRITLSSLPLTSAQANLFIPSTGQFLASGTLGAGVAPVFSTQNQSFTVHLTKKGANLLASALKSGTGLNISYVLKYDGLTPKAGFKLKLHWDQLYKHFSREDKGKLRANYLAFLRLSGDLERKELMDELQSSKCLEVEVIEGSSFKKEDAWKLLDPILARISQEIVEGVKPPATEAEAKAADPSGGGVFGGGGYSVAIKEVSRRRGGTETINFSFRGHVERTTVAGGFVSLKGYPEEVVKDNIIVVPPGPWKSSYFLLPVLGDRLGIEAANMTLTLKEGEEVLSTQTATWKLVKNQGEWHDKSGQPVNVIAFPLLGLGVKDLKRARYRMRLALQTSDDEVILERDLPTFDGSLPLPSLRQNLFDVVILNPSALTFRQLDTSPPAKKSPLEAVHVSLKAGERSLRSAIVPFNDNGQYRAPKPLVWFVPKPPQGEGQTPIMLDLRFQRRGKQLNYAGNGDLKKTQPSLKLILSDYDWGWEETEGK